MRMLTVLVQMMCPHNKREELSQCGHFADKGGKFIAILCGRLLRH